jgi:hypothetical protein
MSYRYFKKQLVCGWKAWLNFGTSEKLLALSMLSAFFTLTFFVSFNLFNIGMKTGVFFLLFSITLYFCYLKSKGELSLNYFFGSRNTTITGGNYNEKVLGDVINIQGNLIDFSNQNLPEFTMKIGEVLEALHSQGGNLEQIRKLLVKDLSSASRKNLKFKKKLNVWTANSNATGIQDLDPDILSIIKEASIIKEPTVPSWLPLNRQPAIDTGIYCNLETFLQEGRWEEADHETCEVVKLILSKDKGEEFSLELNKRLEEVRHNSFSYMFYQPAYNMAGFSTQDMVEVPGDYLKYLNHLWVKYSGGKFGFSVQKTILKKILGRQNVLHSDIDVFGRKIGFIKDNKWIYYSDIEYSIDQAVDGHLPAKILISCSKYADGRAKICTEVMEVLYDRQYE